MISPSLPSHQLHPEITGFLNVRSITPPLTSFKSRINSRSNQFSNIMGDGSQKKVISIPFPNSGVEVTDANFPECSPTHNYGNHIIQKAAVALKIETPQESQQPTGDTPLNQIDFHVQVRPKSRGHTPPNFNRTKFGTKWTKYSLLAAFLNARLQILQPYIELLIVDLMFLNQNSIYLNHDSNQFINYIKWLLESKDFIRQELMLQKVVLTLAKTLQQSTESSKVSELLQQYSPKKQLKIREGVRSKQRLLVSEGVLTQTGNSMQVERALAPIEGFAEDDEGKLGGIHKIKLQDKSETKQRIEVAKIKRRSQLKQTNVLNNKFNTNQPAQQISIVDQQKLHPFRQQSPSPFMDGFPQNNSIGYYYVTDSIQHQQEQQLHPRYSNLIDLRHKPVNSQYSNKPIHMRNIYSLVRLITLHNSIMLFFMYLLYDVSFLHQECPCTIQSKQEDY